MPEKIYAPCVCKYFPPAVIKYAKSLRGGWLYYINDSDCGDIFKDIVS